MNINDAIKILAPVEGGSVDGGLAYDFAVFVKNGKAPDAKNPKHKTQADRLHNRACNYAKEYLETGKIENWRD